MGLGGCSIHAEDPGSERARRVRLSCIVTHGRLTLRLPDRASQTGRADTTFPPTLLEARNPKARLCSFWGVSFLVSPARHGGPAVPGSPCPVGPSL